MVRQLQFFKYRQTSLYYICSMQRPNIKQHIVATASKLFYVNGYNATGINEIIAKSEIAKATLYHHFKSKEDICIAYLESRHQQFLDSLKDFVAQQNKGRQQLVSIFDFLRNMYREGDFHGCWAIKILGELPDNIANISIAETEKISGGIYLLYESAITESHLHKNDWPIHLAKSIAPSLFAEAKLA